MGWKYWIQAFDYPFTKNGWEYHKYTNSFVVAIYYFIKWSIQHFGVELQRRAHDRLEDAK